MTPSPNAPRTPPVREKEQAEKDFAIVNRFVGRVVATPDGWERTTIPVDDMRAVAREVQRLYAADVDRENLEWEVAQLRAENERLAQSLFEAHAEGDREAQLIRVALGIAPDGRSLVEQVQSLAFRAGARGGGAVVMDLSVWREMIDALLAHVGNLVLATDAARKQEEAGCRDRLRDELLDGIRGLLVMIDSLSARLANDPNATIPFTTSDQVELAARAAMQESIGWQWRNAEDGMRDHWRRVARAALTAVCGHAPNVTDAMVERAAEVLWGEDNPTAQGEWADVHAHRREYFRRVASQILTAALMEPPGRPAAGEMEKRDNDKTETD